MASECRGAEPRSLGPKLPVDPAQGLHCACFWSASHDDLATLQRGLLDAICLRRWSARALAPKKFRMLPCHRNGLMHN
jgi:hypothetical protein